MKIALTKYFRFSSSFSKNNKVFGYNYILGVTTDFIAEDEEVRLEQAITKNLIKKIDSRDLGADVDFLKGAHLNDESLLSIFWPIIKKQIHPVPLRSLSLQRDDRTCVTLSSEDS